MHRAAWTFKWEGSGGSVYSFQSLTRSATGRLWGTSLPDSMNPVGFAIISSKKRNKNYIHREDAKKIF
jgi:hypothetical protein